MTPSTRLAQRLALGIPALLLAGAYVSQFGFGLYPCEMCMWQRYAHFTALVFALVSTFAPPPRLWIALAAVTIAASGLIGAFHAGVEYGWWEGITSCAIPASSGGNALEAILNAPIVRCDVAPWSLLGISLAGFNALFSIGGALGILGLLREKVAA